MLLLYISKYTLSTKFSTYNRNFNLKYSSINKTLKNRNKIKKIEDF